MSGFGVRYQPDASFYRGSFRENRRNGYGVEINPDGRKYKGFYQDGVKHGYGLSVLGNNSASIEYWIGGVLRKSKSVETREECEMFHEGKQWMFNGVNCINGLAHGAGEALSKDHSTLIYDGVLVLGKLVEGNQVALMEESVVGTSTSKNDG